MVTPPEVARHQQCLYFASQAHITCTRDRSCSQLGLGITLAILILARDTRGMVSPLHFGSNHRKTLETIHCFLLAFPPSLSLNLPNTKRNQHDFGLIAYGSSSELLQKFETALGPLKEIFLSVQNQSKLYMLLERAGIVQEQLTWSYALCFTQLFSRAHDSQHQSLRALKLGPIIGLSQK